MLIAIIRALIQLGGVEGAVNLIRSIAAGSELSEDQRQLVKASQQSLEDRLDAATGHGGASQANPPIGRQVIG